MKSITFSLNVDEHFVRMLQASVQNMGLLAETFDRQMTAMEVPAVVVLGESRGSLVEDIIARTPGEWREHLCVVPNGRVVIDMPDVPLPKKTKTGKK